MIQCKRCQSPEIIKSGKVRGKQRYRCKFCDYHFVQGDLRKEKHVDKRKLALHLYLENMGFRAIGRVLKVSNVTVLNWVRAYGDAIKSYHESQTPQSKVHTMELDEMWHFIKKKRKLWVWFALDRRGQRIIDFVTGSRASRTGKRLWGKIKDIPCERYTSDEWQAYQTFLPKTKHRVGKAETTQIESSHSNVRYYLARFRRKTKCYSKTQEMVHLSLYLLMYKDLIVSSI